MADFKSQISDLKSCIFLVLGVLSASASAADTQKILIPFDFVSRFDGGRYGASMGDMVWAKIHRQGGFILPESMLDVRDTCRRIGGGPSADMPLDQVRKIVEKDFEAQVGVWGSVERAPGHDEDVYDLAIKCVDFSAAGGPKVIYQCKARTRVVSEIPHVYVKQMLDALYGRAPEGPADADHAAEENWKKNPNLLAGGDFESGAGGVPAGWEPVGGQHREPLGTLVQWIAEPGNPNNKILRLAFDAGVGDNEGVMYFSLPFPVAVGAKYRFQCRWRTTGPAAKVFIKCYSEISDATRGPAQPGSASPERRGREVYRSQQNLKGPPNAWHTHTGDFVPRHTEYAPRAGRVMLYAYGGVGAVDFDDVVVKQILPASPGETVNKEPRHSVETKRP